MDQNYTIELIINVLGIIEKGIQDNCEPTEIKRRITDAIGYNYNYFNELFKNVVGCSLANYIRLASYSHAYKKWSTERPKLKQRDSYSGLDYFLFNFKRMFGSSIFEFDTKGDKIMENISKEELTQINEFLSETPLIESYEFEDGNVKLSFDEDMVLLYMLLEKPYIIHKDLIEKLQWDNLSEDAKKIFLILANQSPDKFSIEYEITMDIETLEHEFRVLDLYNLCEPDVYEDYYIYYYDWPPYLKNIFIRNVDMLLSRVEIAIPGENIPQKHNNILQAASACNGLITTSRMASKSKFSEVEIKEILWEMVQKGFLRLVR